MRRKISKLVCAFALLLGIAYPAEAAVIYVSPNAAGSVSDGRTWATAFHTISEGLSAGTDGDEVWVATAAYTEQLSLTSAVAVYGGFAGTESTREARNPTVSPTVIDGGQAFCPVSAVAVGPGTILDGFVIRNGLVGLNVSEATLVVRNNVFEYNQPAISSIQSDLTVVGNVFLNNSGGANSGGRSEL